MKLKELEKNIGKIYSYFQFFAWSKIGKKYPNEYMKSCCYSYEKIDDNFIAFRKRPKYSENMVVNNEIIGKNNEKCAIIIQGPIMTENEFTIETVKFYRLMYPNISIIVSTWDDTKVDIINKLREMQAIVIVNEKPKNSGLGNINYQIVSTINGIKEARKLGAKYVLKTRTDQRMYKTNVLEYFLGLLKVFPSNANEYGIDQHSRIITMQGTVGGCMFMPFFIADFLFFGHIDDIEKLFSLELNNIHHETKVDRLKYSFEFKGKVSIYEYYKKMAPEIILIRKYIENYSNREYIETVEEYWEFVKKCLICISWDDIGLYWNKYNKYEENINFHTYEINDNKKRYLLYNWTFNNWLSLYTENIKYNSSLELYKDYTSELI